MKNDLRVQSRKSKLKKVALAVPIVVLIVGSGVGVYLWQNQKLTNSNNKIYHLNSQIAALNGNASKAQSQIKTLQDKLNQAKATLDSYEATAERGSAANTVIKTQADLGVTVNGAQYVNPAGSVTAGGKWFGVNITLTNNTSSAISIQNNNFHLKDSQNNEYPEETITGGESTLPSGWTGLGTNALAAGESVRGTIEFQMPDEMVKDFTFTNVTRPFPVHSTN